MSQLASDYAEGTPGEITIVIAGAEAASLPEEAEVDAEIRSRIENGERPKQIAAHMTAHTGRSKRDLYTRALGLRSEDT